MIETLLLMLGAAVVCCAMSFIIGYAGTIAGFWRWLRRHLSCVDYNNLTPWLWHSDAHKPDTRR